MLQYVRRWYHKNYPEDEYYTYIDSKATFAGMLMTMAKRKDVYLYLGVGDSVIRQRLFQKLANLLGCDYDDVYKMWINAR